ncbi:MAG: hypothetical protein ACLP5H_17325 [Desulfomonilaceae bacterium]
MKWKYYIPHVWDKPRQSWEDFYLLPCDPSYRGDSIWLTIDALGDGQSRGAMFQGEDFKRLEKELEGRDYIINGTDMVVKGWAFTKHEFLKWVKVWLEENGFDVDELVEAPLEDFEGTNQHARTVATCNSMVDELESLDPSELDKRLVRVDGEAADPLKSMISEDEQEQK